MIRFFAEHPTAANLLMIIFLVMGALTIPQMRRETFPDFSADRVQVQVVWPGASAQDVEEGICQRIEDAIDGVSNIEKTEAEAREGLGTVTAEMVPGEDPAAFLDDIRTEVDAIDDLPEDAEDPVVVELGRTEQVVSIAVTADLPPSALKAYCEQLKDRLQRTPEVRQVEIKGFSDHQIRIEIPRIILMQHGLSAEDVAAIVGRQSLDLPLGTLETPERDLVVRFTDERRSPHEFADLIVVGAQSGGEIRLGDIATITDMFEDDAQRITFNGARAGILEVTKTRTRDTLTIYDAVRRFLDAERTRAPDHVDFFLTQDMSSIVRDRVQLLTTNAWQGLTLVFLALLLFFNLRFSFWVVLGLPVSFLGAFFFFPLLGLTINMITMVGLLLAIGLLMDDAIVISENIATSLAGGKQPLQAAIEGTRVVLPGVIASFLTTVAVFGPLTTLEGDIGKVLRVMPIVLILVLAVSLVEAFLILPHHLSHAMHHAPRDPGGVRRRIESGFLWLREHVLGRLVDLAVAWRYLTLGLTAMLFLLAVSLLAGGVIKFQAFPDVEGDILQARLLLPQGTPLRRTEAVVEDLRATIREIGARHDERQPGGRPLIRSVSTYFSTNLDAHESGAHVATVSVDLLSAEVRRGVTVEGLLGEWRDAMGIVPDVLSIKFSEPAIGPAGRAIDILIKGENLERLDAAARELKDYLAGFVGTEDLSTDLRPGKPEYRIRLAEGATAQGLDAAAIAGQLRGALQGRLADEIQVDTESYEIDVRLDPADRNGLEDLERFHVTLPDGSQAPLSAMAHIVPGRAWARIAHDDGRRTVRVQGDVDTDRANTREIFSRLRSEFLPDFRARYPDLTIDTEGEQAESAATGKSMGRALLIGMVGIFVLLSFQFRSYVEPLVVMAGIPLALIGVIAGHLLLGHSLTMPSMMGFVSLAGVVVNDSILLVEFIKLRRAAGQSTAEATPLASRERFRAVLLTSTTTIAGLLPLLFERSLQAQVLIPLAISLVFGLLASTLLILVVIPALYTILDDLGLTEKAEAIPQEGEAPPV